MAGPVWLETSKRLRISARLVKSYLVYMFGRLAGGGENLDESEVETELLYLFTAIAVFGINVDG